VEGELFKGEPWGRLFRGRIKSKIIVGGDGRGRKTGHTLKGKELAGTGVVLSGKCLQKTGTKEVAELGMENR